MHRIELTKNFLPNNLQHSIATGILSRTVDKPMEILNSRYKIIEIPENFETIRKSSIGIDRAEREGCLLPERQEDGSRRKQKIIFYMKGWLQNVKTKYL